MPYEGNFSAVGGFSFCGVDNTDIWRSTASGNGRLVKRLWNRSRNNPCFVMKGRNANLEVEIFHD